MAAQIVIPPDLQALVDKRLATGAYEDAEDVLRQALQAQEGRDGDVEDSAAISAHLEESFQQAERGELIDGDQVRREIAELRLQRLNRHQLR